jgi:1,4-alpha-glucan branching enzyme
MQSDDKKFAEIVNNGRKKEFKDFNWPERIKDPSSSAAFTESKLTWSDTARNRFILKLHRDLIDARKSFIAKTVKRNCDVSVDNDTIRIFYPLTGLVITHNFGSSRIKVPGKIHLNTSTPEYGGSNSEPNVIREPGSVLSS